MQPGETITPGPTNQPTPTPPEQKPAEPEQQWKFTPEEAPAPTPTPNKPITTGQEVSWSASEYIAHQKGFSWYILLGLGTVAAAAAVWLLTKDVVSTVVIGLGASMFGVFAARQPKVLNYQINHQGLQIGERFYPHDKFKSFSVQDEGAISSIFLLPLQRFNPGVTMYYPPDEEENIITVLANYLPHEERPADPIDRLMRKVRF